MKNTYKRTLLVAAFLLPLGACESLDDLGRHMPVVGERCENWQCFTEGGRLQSEANKRAIQQGEGGADGGSSEQRIPLNARDNRTAPAQPATSASQGEGKRATPYDMTPDQLDQLPAPRSSSSE